MAERKAGKETSAVTGANGFIGRHLVEQLPNFDAIPHTNIQKTDFGKYGRTFFLSAYGNMADHTDDEMVLQANIEDLVHVVRTTDFTELDSLVYISTSSVRLPIQTMYSRTKRAGEEILLSFIEKYNAPITIVRPLSITGVGEQPNHLIPTLIRSCMEGTPMNFVEEPVHDFLDVDDFVDGVLMLSNRKAKGIYELGSGEGVSNAVVREIVEDVTGKKANVKVVKNMRPYDTLDWVSRNMRAREMGWMPKVTLRESITRMVENYEQTRA